MRKSSETTRLLGTPVVPPVSKTYHGLSLNPRGIHRFTGPPRSQSSSKNGNFLMSSHPLTSLSGLKSNVLAFSSQNGVPVSGLKCQRTTSRTCASSWVFAFLILSSSVTPETGAGLPGVSFTATPRGLCTRRNLFEIDVGLPVSRRGNVRHLCGGNSIRAGNRGL